MTSREAFHNSLELANSNTPPLGDLNTSFTLNPRPSSKFFLTLSFGSSGNFLASPPGIPLQPLKKSPDNMKKKIF